MPPTNTNAGAEPPLTYSLADASPKGHTGNLTTYQTAAAVAAACSGILGGLMLGSLLGGLWAIGNLIIGAFLTLAPDARPHRTGPLMDNLVNDITHGHRQHTGAAEYDSAAHEAGHYLTTGTPAPVPPPSAVGRTKWVTFTWEGQPACMCLQEGVATVAIQTEAPTNGLEDGHDRDQFVESIATLYTFLANRSGFLNRISQIQFVHPIADSPDYQHDPLPDLDHPATRHAAAYRETEDAIAATAEQHHCWWVIRVPPSKPRYRAVKLAMKDSRAGTKEDREIDGLARVVGRELTNLKHGLEDAQYRVLGPMNTAATARAIRAVYDRDYQPLAWNTREPVDPRDAWPISYLGANNWLRVGRDPSLTPYHPPLTDENDPRRDDPDAANAHWYHAVAEIRLPNREVHAGFMEPLTIRANGVPRVIAWTVNLESTDKAVRKARKAVVQNAGANIYDESVGRIVSHEQRLATAASEQAAEAVTYEGRAGARGVCYVLTSGRTEDELEQNKDAIAAACANADVRPHWLFKAHDVGIWKLYCDYQALMGRQFAVIAPKNQCRHHPDRRSPHPRASRPQAS